MSQINLNNKLPNSFEQKKLILSEFDFDKVQKAMQVLEIKYTVSDKQQAVPNKEQLISVADYCIEMAIKLNNKFFSIGGFEAEVISGVIELRFILERVNLLKGIYGNETLTLRNEIQRKS